MSIPVALEQLRDEIARRGDAAFVITTGDAGPHVTSARVGWSGDVLVAGAGTRTASNVVARPALTVLWPAAAFDDYSLIVDGTGVAVDGTLRISPSKAVQHRSAGASADGPTCITVLDAGA
ncbi:MAG: hypothetical protein QOI47_602 [Actinomycetota bacterium]|jgi:hypothetical protein|nr:hypothetical protein [Actinomycetota bacterium]